MSQIKKQTTTLTLQDLAKIAHDFVTEREWTQFHSPKNLSMNLSIEANELMEKFLWITTEQSITEVDKNRQEIEDEIADIFLTLLLIANTTQTDLTTALLHKLEKIKQKYPIEKCRGINKKYNKLT